MQKQLQQDLESIFAIIKNASLKVYEVLKESMGEYTQTTNKTGDLQLQADVLADKIFQDSLKDLKIIKQICSEEQEEAVKFHDEGIYSIAYDPLDGSSLMGANLSVGSIVGIYKGDFLPQNLIAAAYVVYGMVVGIGFASALKEGVDYYIFNGKDFELQKILKLKEKGKLNATGGTQKYWSKEHKAKIESLFNQGYRLRYSGGMVPDLHHILIKGGGLFSYPSTQDSPKGKLRMLFEVFPFAFIFKSAGGEAIDGKNDLLTLTPKHLHDTTPCFLGSKEEIDFVRSY
ncbi:class 1 fructose-bisphosphatase [Helicobacter canadensis]|uniref:Fructose-1,6-bisphosphatase class 1 n=1 Tax=Helicobacter canadensis MIT 98-5491 TaxID=537970 RepID=C5ZV49_9HELI|nr:class 1 fructose-bisphosphatase [Helicobacter canadensis]EES89119.1 fructose-1,6-bisphosphatase [Helicobacter canadensis MIT 98-5491]STO99150.1 fructose-1,6-bisphosphatase [Helicobacter canadensis]